MEIKKQHVPALRLVGRTKEIEIQNLGNNPFYAQTYGALAQHAQSTGTPPLYAVAAYKTWDTSKGLTQVMAAFAVNESFDVGEFETFTVPESPAWVAQHVGAYAGLMDAHKEVMEALGEENHAMTLTLELYLVGPESGKPESEYVTEIRYYVK